jgi:hypothetical protein
MKTDTDNAPSADTELHNCHIWWICQIWQIQITIFRTLRTISFTSHHKIKRLQHDNPLTVSGTLVAGCLVGKFIEVNMADTGLGVREEDRYRYEL